jgi:hypothetical protein
MGNSKKVAPDKHPTAFRSSLWFCLSKIQTMVRAKKSWREIAKTLTDEGTPISYVSVRAFWYRVKDRKARLPAWLEAELDLKFQSKQEQPAATVRKPKSMNEQKKQQTTETREIKYNVL